MRTIGIILFILTGLLIFSNCTRSLDNKPEAPVDLIPRDTMVNIIVDLRIMDAIMVRGQRKATKGINNLKYLLNSTIMTKYNITREQFNTSFYYYESDLKALDEMYADAITKLTLIKGELNKLDEMEELEESDELYDE